LLGRSAGSAGNKIDVNRLLTAGNQLDRGGLTSAGRALQKHGGRAGSVFPQATGNVASINNQGNQVLESILKNPNATRQILHRHRYGNVLEVQIPGGMGARFSVDGKTLIGFLEP